MTEKEKDILIDEIIDIARDSCNDGFNEHHALTEAEKLVERLVKKLNIDDVSVSFLYDFVNEFTDTEIPKEAIKETLDSLNER